MIPQKKCIPLRQKSDKLSRKHLLCKRLYTFHLIKNSMEACNGSYRHCAVTLTGFFFISEAEL